MSRSGFLNKVPGQSIFRGATGRSFVGDYLSLDDYYCNCFAFFLSCSYKDFNVLTAVQDQL